MSFIFPLPPIINLPPRHTAFYMSSSNKSNLVALGSRPSILLGLSILYTYGSEHQGGREGERERERERGTEREREREREMEKEIESARESERERDRKKERKCLLCGCVGVCV